MARVTDPQKIENVRRAAMQLIADYGYHGVSITSIAGLAGVSVGYLYRYYKSKEDLIEDLIQNYFMESRNVTLASLNKGNSVYDITYDIISTIFHWAKTDPEKARFTIRLLQDFDLKLDIEDRFIRDNSTFENALGTLVEIGKKTGELNAKVDIEEILLVLTCIPFKYINNKLKDKKDIDQLGEENIRRITEICVNSLK